jgi:hypothetical protein
MYKKITTVEHTPAFCMIILSTETITVTPIAEIKKKEYTEPLVKHPQKGVKTNIQLCINHNCNLVYMIIQNLYALSYKNLGKIWLEHI